MFNRTSSTSWKPRGLWEVGLEYSGTIETAEYGVDGMTLFKDGESNVPFQGSSIGAINTMEYNNGFFGLGIVGGGFGPTVGIGPIEAMTNISRIMTSRSYGFTAGASYGKRSLCCEKESPVLCGVSLTRLHSSRRPRFSFVIDSRGF